MGYFWLVFAFCFAASKCKGDKMTQEIQELLASATKVKPSSEANEQQRRSFAFGNTNIENSRITRETVDREAEKLNSERK